MKDYISKQKNVQFNVVNTTSNSIFVNLFNINTLSNTPTQPNIAFPSNTQTGTLVQGVSLTGQSAINPLTNDIYVTSEGSNDVRVYDSENNLITSIPLGVVNGNGKIVYNSIENRMYVIFSNSTNVFVIDCLSNTLTSTILLIFATNDIAFNLTNNTVYVSQSAINLIVVIDCSTNTSVGSIVFTNPQALAYNVTDNTIYVNNNTAFTIDKIDCSTNTVVFLGINYVSLPVGIAQMIFNQENNTLYAGESEGSSLVIVDTLKDTLIQQLPIIFVPATFLVSIVLNENENILYILPITLVGGIEIQVLDCSTNTVVNSIPVPASPIQLSTKGLTFNPSNNRLYISTRLLLGNVLVFTTQNIDANPFFISSSGNYNEFLQSIESNPITVECVRIVSENQNQLSNIISIKQIDADGQSLVYPKNPILQVSSYQKQGNISDINFDGLILDGRTFFSDYKIQPNENVAIELCYEQLIRFNISSMFSDRLINKEKISRLKDDINKELNSNYNPNEVKFKISKESDKIEISVSNNTVNPSIFSFFNANQNQLIVNNPSVDFANVSDYNYLVQQLRDSPLVLNGIEVISSLDNQLVEPLTVRTKDANGDAVIYHYFPSNEVDAYQKIGNRSFIETNNLVLDGNTTFPNYVILPNSNLTFVIYYRQFKRCDILNNHNFPILKKPLLSNGMDLAEEMEYYNEVSKKSINIKLNGNK